MRLDLFTLLLVRLLIDGFLVMLFWSYARRHASVLGSRWWAGAAVASAICTLGVYLAATGPSEGRVFYVAGSLTAITLSQVFVWLGLRRYLGLPMQRAVRWSAVGGLLMFGAQYLLLEVWDAPAWRRALFVLASIVLVLLNGHHAGRRSALQSAVEFKAFRILCGVELLVLAVILVRLVHTAVNHLTVPMAGSGLYVVLFFTLDSLVRAALLSGLVSLRLQQHAERDRQKLLDGKADLQALIDNLHAGVVVCNPDRSIDSINLAARAFLRRPNSEGAPGDPMGPQALNWHFLREDGQPMARHERPFERVLASGLALSNVVLGVQSDDGGGGGGGGGGEIRWALCNAFADNDSLGGLRHVVLTFVDITSMQVSQRDQKALQIQLSQSQKMEALGTLAGGVAHDFNNILTAILGNADLARQDLVPGALAFQSLTEISTAARRGRELVRQILAFSRQQPLERKRVSMRAILAESCGLLKPVMPPQVKLCTACGSGDLSINADVTQLGQVLLNLGTNALHALAGRPGQLTMQVNRFAVGASLLPSTLPKTWLGVIRLQVRDSGCGMDEATRLRIFEPFFTTRKMGTGTGLGLPVVLGVVEGHGGVIEVESRLGEGTTFTLYFPAAVPDVHEDEAHAGWPQGDAEPDMDDSQAPHVNGPTAASSVQNKAMTTETPTEKRHVLYLDDDDTLVFLVRRLLERRGYKVTTFTDQDAAIEAVRADPQGFDLLMTDFNMPGMSGLEVARAVLAINPDLPVAVASGYITDELQAEAMAAGVREVVFKTDAVEDFCSLVAKLVEL